MYLAQKKDTKEVCALKVMSKKLLFKLDEVRHILTERDILTAAKSEWLVKLLYAFQDDQSIYLAMVSSQLAQRYAENISLIAGFLGVCSRRGLPHTVEQYRSSSQPPRAVLHCRNVLLRRRSPSTRVYPPLTPIQFG